MQSWRQNIVSIQPKGKYAENPYKEPYEIASKYQWNCKSPHGSHYETVNILNKIYKECNIHTQE